MSRFASPIFAAIVVMWALVLLPLWARRHHEALLERTGEGLSRTVRVLARRPPSSRSKPTHPQGPHHQRSPTQRGPTQGSPSQGRQTRHRGQPLHRFPPKTLPPSLGKPRAAARRRARRRLALTLLLLLCLLAAGVVVFTKVGILLMALPLSLLGPYLVLLRAVARHDRPPVQQLTHREGAWSGGEAQRPATQPSTQLASTPAVSHSADHQELPQPLAPPAVTAHTTPLFDAQAPQQPASTPEQLWHPREALLPTYVKTNTMHRRSIVMGGAWKTPQRRPGLSAEQRWHDETDPEGQPDIGHDTPDDHRATVLDLRGAINQATEAAQSPHAPASSNDLDEGDAFSARAVND